MVDKTRPRTSLSARLPLLFLLALGMLLAACWMLLPIPIALADGIYIYNYQVQEEYTIDVNEVGDATCKDVLVYDRSFFNKQGFNFEHYPFLLSRRYCEPCDVGEIQNFKADIDSANSTVTITFDQPGRAYNQGTHWEMYGFYSKPKFEVEGKQVFEEESTVNSEFTLWEDLDFKTTVYVRLPEGAQNVRYDTDNFALLWELPYTAASTSVFSRNPAVFVPIFAVLIVAGLVLAAFVLVRGRHVGRNAAGRPSTAVINPQMATGSHESTDSHLAASSRPTAARISGAETTGQIEPPPAPRAAVGPGEGSAIGGEQVPGTPPTGPKASPAFCRHCGESLGNADSRFCPMCGKPVDNSH